MNESLGCKDRSLRKNYISYKNGRENFKPKKVLVIFGPDLTTSCRHIVRMTELLVVSISSQAYFDMSIVVKVVSVYNSATSAYLNEPLGL